MKKTCNGCRALSRTGCGLNKKTEATRLSHNGYPAERKPLEECPKPKTYSDYIYLIKQL